MTDLQDLRQARVAAALVAADDRFNAWQRANKELGDEFRAARVAAAETRTAGLLRSSPDYEDLQRRRATDRMCAALTDAVTLGLSRDAILAIVNEAVAKEAV